MKDLPRESHDRFLTVFVGSSTCAGTSIDVVNL